jgi:hypothetical protein
MRSSSQWLDLSDFSSSIEPPIHHQSMIFSLAPAWSSSPVNYHESLRLRPSFSICVPLSLKPLILTSTATAGAICFPTRLPFSPRLTGCAPPPAGPTAVAASHTPLKPCAVPPATPRAGMPTPPAPAPARYGILAPWPCPAQRRSARVKPAPCPSRGPTRGPHWPWAPARHDNMAGGRPALPRRCPPMRLQSTGRRKVRNKMTTLDPPLLHPS